MTTKIGFITDPLSSLNPAKDSTIAMMQAAQKRDWKIYCLSQGSVYCTGDSSGMQVRAQCQTITLDEQHAATSTHWYRITSEQEIALTELDVIFMRKDPPFDMEYINTTYLLDLCAHAGVLVVNQPSALRDANEKMFITQFPQCCTPMCISSKPQRLRQFIEHHGDVIIKPLDGMGGAEIFRLKPDDANLSVILETSTRGSRKTLMAQCFIPEIAKGDKRILLIDGEPIPYALARIPAAGETRGNLAAGGSGVGVELTERDHWICQQIAETLTAKGILFAGIDVIGDYLTEINITSPTCIRELDTLYTLDIASKLMDAVADKLKHACASPASKHCL